MCIYVCAIYVRVVCVCVCVLCAVVCVLYVCVLHMSECMVFEQTELYTIPEKLLNDMTDALAPSVQSVQSSCSFCSCSPLSFACLLPLSLHFLLPLVRATYSPSHPNPPVDDRCRNSA